MVMQDVTGGTTGGTGPAVANAGGGSTRPALLPELLSAAVAGAPEETAVWSDAGPLSFAELDAAANRLARLLIEIGRAHV